MDIPDWTLLRSFLAVAETGSLSAAARLLGQSQPTIGRHVALAEEALGVALFTRHARGLHLTDAGAELLPAARDMGAAAHRLGLTAAGQSQTLEGTVRVTASVVVAHFHLPRLAAIIRAEAPGIEVEILPSDSNENLLFREADIAVRMVRPTEPEIVARYLGEIEIGLFAATSYLDRRGRPHTIDDLGGHDLVGLDRSDLIIRGMRTRGVEMRRSDFATRCDDQALGWHLVRAGCGLGFGQVSVAKDDPLVERVLPGLDIPTLPVWLAAPDALRRSPRIRFVYDLLAREIAPLCAA